MWVHGYYCAGLGRHNSTNLQVLLSIYQLEDGHKNQNIHAPTSPSLLNTHEISYPHPTPTPLHHTQDACQSTAAYKFCCQSINLKMVIRTKTSMHPHRPPYSTHMRSRTPIQPQPPLHHTQDACQSIAAYKFVVNLST